MKHTSLIFCSAAVVACVACNIPAKNSRIEITETYISDPNSVGFDITPLPSDGSSRLWLATYNFQGKTAKFRIELGPSTPINDKESREFDIESGKGRFIPEPGSDASVLLANMKKALEAKTIPTKVQRVGGLPFQFVSFGRNQSQAAGGGFNAKPPGNWMPMKIFIGEGESEGEIFLNLNPVIKKGQFSIKDEEYGDIVLAHLAQVL